MGSYSLSSNSGDPASYGLIDPLDIRQSLPTADLAPLVQCNPDEATITVLAPDPFAYSFSLGDQVRVTMYSSWTPGGSNVAFFGRVAQLQAQPHKMGVLYTLQCVDYLADLAELKAGHADYPVESSLTRVNRMLAENGIGSVVTEGIIDPGAGFNDPNVVARLATEGQLDLPAALELVLAGWPQSFKQDETGAGTVNANVSRYELRPNIVNPGGVAGQGSLDPAHPFKLSPIFRAKGWTPPARLGAAPGAKLSVSKHDTYPATDTLTLDAGHVDYNPVFAQQKGNAVQRVVVAFPGGVYSTADWLGMGYYQWRADSSTVEATVTCWQQTSTGVASSMYRGTIQPDPSLQWTVGELSWRFSRTEREGADFLKLRRVVIVTRVDAANVSARNPTGRTWVVGVVDSIRATILGGELVMAFTLAPMHYTKAGPQFSGVPGMALISEWLPTLRRNLNVAPQAIAGCGWAASNAWTPAATLTDTASGGPAVGPAVVPFRRFTSTGTNTPASSAVIALQQHSLPGYGVSGTSPAVPGDQITLSVYVRCSIAQTVLLQCVLMDANGSGSGSSASANVTLVANTWTRLERTITVPDGDTVAIRTDVRAGTSGRLAWAVGTTFDVAAGQAELAPAATSYFDGSFAAAGTLAYTWEHSDGVAGTANAVPSVEQRTGLLISDLDTRDTFGDYLLMHA